MKEVACNLCGSREYIVLYEPRVALKDPLRVFSASGGVRGTQRVITCRGCGLIYVSPRPDDNEVLGAYAQAVDDDYIRGGAGREKTFSRGLDYLEDIVVEKGRILDCGCADGIFIALARARGWEATGIELCAHLADAGRRAHGISVMTGDLAQARFDSGSFDVVTMWDVLEHVPDPMSHLRECQRILKREGVLLINFPDIGSIQARLAGRWWWFLLSSHLYYFTRRTMAAYCAKTGFTECTFSMHWQWLPLEHLLRISRIYLGRGGEFLAAAAGRAKAGKILIPYYAAQTNMIARKA